MRLESLGATATAMRPYGLRGDPALPPGGTSGRASPPHAERKRPLPDGAVGVSPPERNVHPLRRKSHKAAKITFGSTGSSVKLEQPVERFAPRSTRLQVLATSTVL